MVLLFHVQAQADYLRITSSRLVDVVVESAKDAAATRVGLHVDALNPPEPTVAPVAELVGDLHLAEDLAVLLGEEVWPFRFIGQRGHDPCAKDCQVEGLVFRLLGQATVELDNQVGVGDDASADGQRHGCLVRGQSVSFHRCQGSVHGPREIHPRHSRFSETGDSLQGYYAAAGRATARAQGP